MLPPLLLVGGLLVLGPEAGVMFPGIYLVVLIVILVSGVLQTIAFVSWVTVIRRLFSNTVVAIVSVGIAFLVIDWVVFCVVAEVLLRVVS
ncbi:hypothetical protein [Rubripirellula tenax]|nr:hypothetical protein [Rubripirellula tenax]